MATISVTLPTDGTTADVADVNTPITTIVNEINGNLDNANIKSAAAISGSKLADNSIDITSKASSFDGWVKVTDSWAYASSTTVTVPTDATTKYPVGTKVKFVQSGSTKYFDVTAVASTVLTLSGRSSATVANVAISDIYYSLTWVPLGTVNKFTDANGWTVYDYGTWKEYKKRVTFSQTISGGAGLTVSSNNLPSGMSTISTNFVHYSFVSTGNAFGLNIGYEGSSSTATLNFTTSTNDGVSRAYTGFIDVTITSP